MPVMKVVDGNSAIAEAVRQVNPDVVVVHPVTPAVPMVEKIASFVANGQMDTEVVNVESGYSAVSGCIGASAAGGRVFTASASQGLASMHEILYIAASLRLPIVAGVANRALSAPENIHADHSDAMAEQDSGWMQFFCENPQEAYDNLIQAYKIAEHPQVRTPVMVGMDGFLTSHSMENIAIEETGGVDDFVGKFNPLVSLLDSENPVTLGSYAPSAYYFEHKINQRQGMEEARKIIKEVGREFGDRFGRYYGYFESYKMDDADYIVVLMGSAAGTAKEAVDRLRTRGEKVGLLKFRVFRPFPYQELKEILSSLTSIAVLDRSFSPGTRSGPLFNETRSALYDADKKPLVFPYVYGLGGRDISVNDFEGIFKEIKEKSEKDEFLFETHYIGLRK
ncbi:MAG: pyruvate ferredoxin oxidoreductase [Candidatus Aminicenantes bacterium]|nr:MAG: pyruvate ferredoxin oxidoreductase [Candidatus Aminicenantes bacterium]